MFGHFKDFHPINHMSDATFGLSKIVKKHLKHKNNMLVLRLMKLKLNIQ